MNIMGITISLIVIAILHIFLKKIGSILSENEKLIEKFKTINPGYLNKETAVPFKRVDTTMPFNVNSQDFNNFKEYNTINVNDYDLDTMKGELLNYLEDKSNLFDKIPTYEENKILNENVATFKDVGHIKPETLIRQDQAEYIVNRKDTVPLSSSYPVQFDKQFKQKLYLSEPAANKEYRTYKKDNWVYENEKSNNGGYIDTQSKLMAYDYDGEMFAAL